MRREEKGGGRRGEGRGRKGREREGQEKERERERKETDYSPVHSLEEQVRDITSLLEDSVSRMAGDRLLGMYVSQKNNESLWSIPSVKRTS